MAVWDNQQEISWFTGILEAEGCAHRDAGQRRKISVTNTDIEIIDHCLAFLNTRSFAPTMTEQIIKGRGHKKVYNINVSGANECYTLIKKLGHVFQCRRQEFLYKLELSSSTTTRDTTLIADDHWLIGFFEGEGWIGIEKSAIGRFTPVIGLKNTKKCLIAKYVTTLKSLGCSWTTDLEVSSDPARKDLTRIRIRKLSCCLHFLRKVRRLFRSSYYNRRAELLFQFCESRVVKSNRTPYLEIEIQAATELMI